ncbi:MAG: RNA polymerase sigma factor [Pseudobacter sp.]|uniref:RNA polymerase sigma factor n=1 Tax=Pseudobacter sp. TaxID=2045420 RepID=UPI003F803FF2
MTSTTNHRPFLIAMKEEHLCVQPVCRRDVPVYLFQYQYTKLVKDWTAQLQYVSWRITGNKQAAEDIVQEAFLELWLQHSKILPGNPVGWLIKVVTNLSRKHIRYISAQTRIHNRFSNNNNFHNNVEEEFIGKEKESFIRKAFSRLPAQQQLVLYLSKEQGLRRDEIADRLQLSPNTVKVHLLRAMQFMKEHIGCILLFSAFFACNNYFFRSGNTKPVQVELYNTPQVVKEHPVEKVISCISFNITFTYTR